MCAKSIISVDFIFKVDGYEAEGKAALFFRQDVYIPMTDDEILKEIKRQYGYEAIQLLHQQKEQA